MMKKLTSILMAAGLAFALAACGQTQQTELTNSSVTDKQTDNEETSTQSASKITEPSEVPETASLSETDENTLICLVAVLPEITQYLKPLNHRVSSPHSLRKWK